MSRSPDRERFLREVLGILAEQGLQFGAGEAMAVERNQDGEYISVTVRYPHANSAGMIGRRMTTDDIAQGLILVRDTVMVEDQAGALAALGIDRDWRNKIALVHRHNDSGAIRPVDAANLAELSFFGKVEFE